MAVEFRANLIQRIKCGFRNEAGVSSYDPDRAKLPTFPTLDETVASFDPSPDYLRCKKCHGRLLSDLLSLTCICCGVAQRRDGEPSTMSFTSTRGCRKFLESLNLDGSEAISLDTAAAESTGGQNASKGRLLLSDLLDFELCWPEEKETENSSTDRVPTLITRGLNLIGVDLEDFFSETRMVTPLIVSDEQLVPEEHVNSTNSFLCSAQTSVSMFENSQSSCFAENSQLMSEAGEVGDSFLAGEAEADFLSANSESLPVYTKTVDPFLVTCTSNLTGSLDETATLQQGIDTTFEDMNEVNDGQAKNVSSHFSSRSAGWSWNGLWHPSSATLSSNTGKIIEREDPLESWQELASSGGALDPFLKSWPQSGTPVISESAPQTNTEALANNLQERDFGCFFQPDPFLRPLDSQKGSANVNVVQLETSFFDRKTPRKFWKECCNTGRCR